MSDNPFASPQQPLGGAALGGPGLDYEAIRPLFNAAGWLKFLGIVNIVLGVIYCITIIGALVGWLPLWLGILLNQAGVSIRNGYEQRNPAEVQTCMSKLGLVATIMGVLMIINLAIIVLYILGVILFVGLAGVATVRM